VYKRQLLGWSTAQLAAANGYEVIKTQVVNDRGIAVCKSMMAWQKTADGATYMKASMRPIRRWV